VTDDAEALNAVVQSIEARVLQLTETFGDDAAARPEASLEAVREANVEAVEEQMPPANAPVGSLLPLMMAPPYR